MRDYMLPLSVDKAEDITEHLIYGSDLTFSKYQDKFNYISKRTMLNADMYQKAVLLDYYLSDSTLKTPKNVEHTFNKEHVFYMSTDITIKKSDSTFYQISFAGLNDSYVTYSNFSEATQSELQSADELTYTDVWVCYLKPKQKSDKNVRLLLVSSILPQKYQNTSILQRVRSLFPI